MLQIQYDLFDENRKLAEMDAKIEAVETTSIKVRKCVFAKVNSVEKYCNELKERLEILEKNICLGGK